jgi:hypothetical protein
VGTVARIVVDGTPPADNANSNFSNPSQTATVTVSIRKDYAPLHQGATAAIRPKSLLGEKCVAMTVGDPSRPVIPDSATLPASATSVNVELEQLVNIFDAPTRAQLQKLIDSLGIGLAGQGRTAQPDPAGWSSGPHQPGQPDRRGDGVGHRRRLPPRPQSLIQRPPLFQAARTLHV